MKQGDLVRVKEGGRTGVVWGVTIDAVVCVNHDDDQPKQMEIYSIDDLDLIAEC